MDASRSVEHFDLQSHSTFSDGALEPAEVVKHAADAGVTLLALTDHDTVEGVSEAIACGQEVGVTVVPAVEISSLDDGRHPNIELHILGYLVDYTGPVLSKALGDWIDDRRKRTLRMADGLREVGLKLDETALEKRIQEGRSIGRVHLAEAALDAPENAERLAAEGIDEIGGLIRGYLIEGKAAFRLRQTPTVAEAIDVIHAAGGVAVWAHPFWDLTDPDDVVATIDRFHGLGIDGVEAFYISHKREQTAVIAERCAELGLLTTGSADFHGPDNNLFGHFRAFDTFGFEPNLGPIADHSG
jgi:predicted metal-dependent phosphoesterase TrpH